MNPLFGRLFQMAARRAPVGFKAPKVALPAVDTLTNPNTYRQLVQSAERTLGGALPPQFSGQGFGRLPGAAIGWLNDVAGMAPGRARSATAGITSRALRELAGEAPRVPGFIQQYGSGALRAPSIGDLGRAGQNIISGAGNALAGIGAPGGPFARDPGLRREFLRAAGGTSEKAAQLLSRSMRPAAPIPGAAVNTSAVGGLLRNLGAVSGAMNALPGPGWAKALGAGLLGGGTSIGGTLFGLSTIGGSSPQSDDALDRWQQLGYKSKQDMYEKVNQQAQLENRSRAIGKGTFGPSVPGGLSLNGGTPPMGSAPPAPVLPDPFTGGTPGGFSGGQQAGQQTPSAVTSPPVAPQLPGTAMTSNGAGVPAQRQNVQQRALSQEVLNAAQQYSSPAGVPLSSFYEGQQQLGRSMNQSGELQRQLKELGGASGMNDQALAAWAKANPALAYREMLRLQGRNSR